MTMMARLSAAVLAVAVLGVGMAGWAGHGPASGLFDSRFLKLCEEELKPRLRSPSTYQRISAEPVTTDVTLETIHRYTTDLTETERKLIADGRLTPVNFALLIRYEAANAYGTPVAGITACEYFSMSGNLDRVTPSFLKIDGETNIDRLLGRVLGG